jgi:hypothetical protein
MDFFLQYFKITTNLQELEHSIFLLQIQKELTKNWGKNSNLFEIAKLDQNFLKH